MQRASRFGLGMPALREACAAFLRGSTPKSASTTSRMMCETAMRCSSPSQSSCVSATRCVSFCT